MSKNKKKISKKINNLNRNLSYNKICKLREKISKAEELQERFFKEKKEKEEKEAWTKMKKIKQILLQIRKKETQI